MKFKYFLVFAFLLLAHIVAGVIYSGYEWWWILLSVFFLLGILVLACMKINWNFFMVSTNRVPLSLKQFKDNIRPIALTFDDGPHENTVKVLDILKSFDVKATFFVIGKAIEGKEEILKRIVDEGHLIGNHTYSHEGAFYWQSVAKMKADIQKCNDLILKNTGVEPNIFRPPFGVTNPNLAKALDQMSLQSVGWTLRSYDTVAKDEKKLLKSILKKVRNNQTILLHDRCDITVKILPELITQLKERNFSFSFPVVMEA